jgi:hypothetical protein
MVNYILLDEAAEAAWATLHPRPTEKTHKLDDDTLKKIVFDALKKSRHDSHRLLGPETSSATIIYTTDLTE